MLKTKIQDALRIASEARRRFETGQVKGDILERLYMEYNQVDDIDIFVQRSKELFPNLNCGLATLYIREVLGEGEVINGRYNGENHTFLLLNGDTVVDITSDQYGGPRVYVGPLKKPWKLRN